MKKNYFLKSLFLIVLGITSTVSFGQTTTLNYTGAIQNYTVPVGVTSISIETWGAQGGNNIALNVDGGLGAYMKGDFVVTPGQVIQVLVGQQGTTQTGNPSGGGGSFVATVANVPMIVSGGGGGSGNQDNGIQTHATITTTGNSGWHNTRTSAADQGRALGGTAGNGGDAGRLTSGGGGFYTDGAQAVSDGGASISGPGIAFINGGTGGFSSTSVACNGPWTTTPGGFGGGGGAGYAAAGGGGGYSGGGGTSGCPSGSGGGGGSYNNGTNQTNTALVRTGNGLVVITVLCTSINVSVTPSINVCEGDAVTITGTSTGVGVITWDNGITNGVPFANPTAGVTTYTSTSTDGNDCGSQIVVTVSAPTASTDVHVACDTYTWIDANVYTASNNTATVTLTNAAGCDSVVTLDLTINNSNAFTDVQVACDTYTWIDANTYTANNNTATVTITNAAGCDSVVTLDLTINVSPFVLMNPFNQDTICETDNSTNLPAVTPTGGTYSGPGVSGNMFDPSIAGIGSHYVVYTYTDGNGCAVSDSSLIEVISCVGINENSPFGQVSIYPNPANNIINVSLTKGNSPVNFTLLSIDGKVVYQLNNVTDKTVAIDISNNSKGIYFLRIDNDNDYNVYKVIKQ
ncbi:MAG: T9SS type A sorting domain-containing protein [Flavobacteriales bacterium]|nr:T9SS type A sorting domain-containing protein [Flavobacteriales bacterium]